MNGIPVKIVCLALLLIPGLGLCLSDRDILRLKKDGVGDETIVLMIREKTIETCALTVEQILRLKRAGFDERSLQALVRGTSFRKDAQPIRYGGIFEKSRFPSVDEIIALKQAGVSDPVIQALIVRGAAGDETPDTQRAWQMLDNMKLKVEQPLTP